MGFAISYLLFISKNAHELYGLDSVNVVATCMPVLILLSWLPDMKSLAPLSAFAIGANFMGQAVVYLVSLQLLTTAGIPPAVVLTWTETSLPFFVGVCVYCFEGVVMVLLVEEEAADKRGYPRTLTLVVAIYTVTCSAFGSIGYMAFGDGTQDIITLNLGGGTLATITTCSLCIALYFTFPVSHV